jgi:hypothetical protein
MQRFLGLSQEEIKQNEKLWHEERTEPEDQKAKGSDLRGIGLSTADIDADLESAENMPEPGEEPEAMAPEVTAPVGAPAAGAPGPETAPPPV